MKQNYPRIKNSERAIIAGRTGSGKSTLATWLLKRSKQHWVILNPKWTGAYNSLPGVEIIKGFNSKKLERSIDRNNYTVVNFTGEQANPEFMDSCIAWLHNRWENLGLCADELYTLHTGNARPGAGLTGWLTRGRELRQSFLGLTQRPAWVSKFLFSEADYIGSMDLQLPEDRKRMVDVSGSLSMRDRLTPHHWLWYRVRDDSILRYGPVPIDSIVRNK